MSVGAFATGVSMVQENPVHALQGGLITHTAVGAALVTYTPAPAQTFDTATVTNASNSTWIRITIVAVGTTGSKAYLVAPTQAVSVGFAGADQITAISSVPVVMPTTQGAVEVTTLATLAATGEIVQVSIVFVEK